MRGTSRSCLLGAVLLLALPLAVAHAHPSQEFRAGDPAGLAAAYVWLGAEDGERQSGGEVQVGPPAPSDSDPEPDEPGGPRRPQPGVPAVEPPAVEPPSLEAGAHLPDLAPLPVFDFLIVARSGEAVPVPSIGPPAGDRRALLFEVDVVNQGAHALELLLAPGGDAGEPERLRALQCVRFTGVRTRGAGPVCQEHTDIGAMRAAPAARAVELPGVLRYRLLRDRGGAPDTGPGGVLAAGQHDSLCLADDESPEPALLLGVDDAWYRECRSVSGSLRQGVSPGWATTWSMGTPGLSLPVDGLPDGLYWLEVTVNGPQAAGGARLLETNWANNTSVARLRILDGGQLAEPASVHGRGA